MSTYCGVVDDLPRLPESCVRGKKRIYERGVIAATDAGGATIKIGDDLYIVPWKCLFDAAFKPPVTMPALHMLWWRWVRKLAMEERAEQKRREAVDAYLAKGKGPRHT